MAGENPNGVCASDCLMLLSPTRVLAANVNDAFMMNAGEYGLDKREGEVSWSWLAVLY